MGCDELLLLADGTQEAERVHAEAGHPKCCQCQQRSGRAEADTDALAPAWRGEHEERKHEPGGELHADTRRQRSGPGAQAGIAPGAEGERERDRQ